MRVVRDQVLSELVKLKKEERQIVDDQEILEVRSHHMGVGGQQSFERRQQMEEGQSLLLCRVNSAR